jgi:hypothetical protein
MTITRLHCSSCDTSLEGRFASSQLANLSSEQLDFILTFVRCEGKLNRIELEEKERWGSYPSIRNRLLEVIRALGYEPGREDSGGPSEARQSALENLAAGRINAETAIRILRGEEDR